MLFICEKNKHKGDIMDYLLNIISGNVLSVIVIVLWLEMDYSRHKTEFNDFDNYFKSVSGSLFLTMFLSITLNFVPFLGVIVTLIVLIVYSFRDIIYYNNY